MNKAVLIIMLALLASSLAACGSGDTPEKAAQEWAEASASMNAGQAAQRTCVSQQPSVQKTGLWPLTLSTFGEQQPGTRIDVDLADLVLTMVDRGGNTADLVVTGEIRVTVRGITKDFDVDETWHMVREDGRWKWCGATSNLLAP